MLANEIAALFTNIQTNILGKTLVMGFSQVARSKQVRDFFIKGREIATKHIAIFSAIMTDAADIMIHNGWMEEPPQAPNRKALVKA